MMRTSPIILVILLSAMLAACGKSPTKGTAGASADAAPSATAGGDPCALIDDANALFGQPVTASLETAPNQACFWKSAEGRVCGSVVVLGPGWNDVPPEYLEANYSAMVRSLGAFGTTRPVTGIGEEATAVDGEMLGTQIALRTRKAVVNIAAACGGSKEANSEHAEKVARAVAAKL